MIRRAPGASNWGWTSSDLKKAYDQRKSDWQKTYGPGDPPMDMLFASASGLDPQISPESAEIQAKTVAAARHLDRRRLPGFSRWCKASRKGHRWAFWASLG